MLVFTQSSSLHSPFFKSFYDCWLSRHQPCTIYVLIDRFYFISMCILGILDLPSLTTIPSLKYSDFCYLKVTYVIIHLYSWPRMLYTLFKLFRNIYFHSGSYNIIRMCIFSKSLFQILPAIFYKSNIKRIETIKVRYKPVFLLLSLYNVLFFFFHDPSFCHLIEQNFHLFEYMVW